MKPYQLMAINIPDKKVSKLHLNLFGKICDSNLKKNKDKEIKILQTKVIYVPLSRLKRYCIGDHKKLGTVPK
jgi:hypothetical protein